MIQLRTADYFVFGLYFLAFIGIGLWSGRKKKTNARDFFITQNRLPWYVIGFSLIAAGISSEQFLGTVGFAYSHGLSVANWEWLNGPSILVLVFLFIPFYLKKKIVTMPQFLEKRFDSRVRTLFAIITILVYVFINLAGVTYSGGFALSKILGLNLYACIWIIALTAGFFTIYGGMATIAWTNVFQACMLIGSGILVFILGLTHVGGGFQSIIGTGSRAHLILPASDPDIPWTGLLSLMLSTNIWYYCTSQNINQSTLGAKNKWHAQVGVLFAGALWLLIPFADTFPGLIAYAINPKIQPDSAFIFVINRLIPAGVIGIIFAVLCASVISAIQAGINGVSTIFTFDFYQHYVDKQASEQKLIRVGRTFAAAALIVGAIWAPMVLRFGQIFSYFQECWAFIAIPISVTFVMGVLWRRVHAVSAFYTLILAFPMFLMPYLLRVMHVGMNVFFVAFIVFGLTVLYIIVLTLLTSPRGTEDENMAWKFFGKKDSVELAIAVKTVKWYMNVGILAGLMIAAYIIIYIIFW